MRRWQRRRGKAVCKRPRLYPSLFIQEKQLQNLFSPQQRRITCVPEGYPSDRQAGHTVLRFPTFQPRRDQNSCPHPNPHSDGLFWESQGVCSGFSWASVEWLNEHCLTRTAAFPGGTSETGREGRQVCDWPQGPGLVPETHRCCPFQMEEGRQLTFLKNVLCPRAYSRCPMQITVSIFICTKPYHFADKQADYG